MSLLAALVVLSMAERGLAPRGLLVCMIANLVGLRTALSAWLITYVLVAPRREVRRETIGEFVTRQVGAFRQHWAQVRSGRH